MARHPFGLTAPDWTFTYVDAVDGNNSMLQGVAGATVTFWNAETGGSQYTDLTDSGGTAVDHVTTSDGTDGRALGTIPPLYGPDGVWVMWASANGGPRILLVTPDAAAVAGPAIEALQSAYAAHTAALNPHGARSRDLTDVDTTAPLDGQVLMWDGAQYVPTTVEGLDIAQFVGTGGGSTILIPEGNTNTVALQIRLPSGARDTAANTLSVWWNAGSAGTPTWVETFRIGPRGELVLSPSAIDRGPLDVRQYSGSQTANLTTWSTSAGSVLSQVDSAGRVRAPNIGLMPTWHIDTATVATGTYRFYNTSGTTLQLRNFTLSAGGDAPTGADLIIDPKMDGTALYSAANRPKILAGSRYSGLATSLATTAWPANSYLTVDVVQVGSGTAGTKITIQALAY